MALCVAVTLLAFCLVCPTFAATYGNGSYNKCAYGCVKSSGTTSQPQTNVTTSSGFKVTINLTNGQKIPATGYTVIVQPAGSQTITIQAADFYLNSALQFSGTANNVGAVRWLWLPTQTSGDATIKIVITGSDGSVSTREFKVTIGTPETPPPVTNTGTNTPNDPVSNISHAVLSFVSTLPTPVLYGLPYFLFALLAVNIVLLLVQTQREIRELAVLQRIIELERKTGLEKNTFVSLASHYLRTPISILQGGFDLLKQQTAMPAAAVLQANQLVDGLRHKVNDILAQTENGEQTAGVPSADQLPSAWKNPGLYVPIVLIGLFALLFNYIAAHVQAFSVGQLNIIVQIVAYALLATVFYQVFRRHQLRRRDTRGMQQALAHEQAINQARDDFISTATTLLTDDMQSLRDITAGLPPGQATQFVKEGIRRFSDVLVKFAIAARLKSGQSQGPATETSLSTLFGIVPQQLKYTAAQKKLQISVAQDLVFTVQNPKLVAYVLASLIDNAIAYSPDGQSIELRANQAPSGITISVIDHGSGIDSQKMSLLFRPFTQTQDVERFTHEGMGFSLYLDKLIMTYLGGTIVINSRPSVETAATITLPA